MLHRKQFVASSQPITTAIRQAYCSFAKKILNRKKKKHRK